MGVQSHLTADGRELIISIDGRFDFSAHQNFRDSYESKENSPNVYKIDMNETTYLDSSALGMLLLLRDYAGNHSSTIIIINCSDDVKKILTISNFEQLFDIQ